MPCHAIPNVTQHGIFYQKRLREERRFQLMTPITAMTMTDTAIPIKGRNGCTDSRMMLAAIKTAITRNSKLQNLLASVFTACVPSSA